jgi:hypothetical protein
MESGAFKQRKRPESRVSLMRNWKGTGGRPEWLDLKVARAA